MYRSKDLTEETEEIILKRQRIQVESSRVRLKEAETRPGCDPEGGAAAAGAGPARETRPPGALDLEKARDVPAPDPEPEAAGPRQAEVRPGPRRREARDLSQDRDPMTVKAPADGLVYYGRRPRASGRHGGGHGLEAAEGGAIMADEVFITVVSPPAVAGPGDGGREGLASARRPRGAQGPGRPAGRPEPVAPARLTRVGSGPSRAPASSRSWWRSSSDRPPR